MAISDLEHLRIEYKKDFPKLYKGINDAYKLLTYDPITVTDGKLSNMELLAIKIAINIKGKQL